jgi:hypothetical protein
MKDSHLSVRLPASLVRALARRARDAGVARSHVIREAVSAYVSGPPPPPRREVTATELAERWRALPRLTPEEAAALGADMEAAREGLPAPPAWE